MSTTPGRSALTLPASSRLTRIDGVQICAFADGRLLIRHPGGSSIRPAFPLAELMRILDLIDGRRTLAELIECLSEYEEADVARLLQTLLGDVLTLEDAPVVAATSARILVWGRGAVCERLLAELRWRPRAAVEYLSDAPRAQDLRGADLLIAISHDSELGSCFQLQRLALRAGVPALFLTGEAGQLLLGPPALPGLSACLACFRATPFARQLGDPGATLSELGKLRQSIDSASGALALAFPQLLATVDEVLGDRCQDYFHGRVYFDDGRVLRRPQSPLPDCPICAAIAPAHPPRQLTHALDSQRDLLLGFTRSGADPDASRSRASVCVLGGGSAGFLAALALKARDPGRPVTLIHSSDLPIIGVGEATTPLMPQFLHADLGIDPERFFREVQPTFKLGIRFNWDALGGGFNYPFGPLRLLDAKVHDGDLRHASLQSMLMDQGRLPIASDGAGCINAPELAYHLDNRRVTAFLCAEAGRRGVQILDRRIVSAQTRAGGDGIDALLDDSGGRHIHDFYLDCSGFRAQLIGEALQTPFVDFSTNLLTDRAVVAALPPQARMRPYTSATAMQSGWCWEIPQWQERHLGYVYCSGYVSDEEARAEFVQRFGIRGPTRIVHFRPGRRAAFVRGNVAALGNAYGFVEPLESTSLHLLIRQLGLLLRADPFGDRDGVLAPALNRHVNAWWDYLRWFLALHYKFNRGMDTPFWRHCRDSVDVSAFGELLEAFRVRGPLSANPGVVDGFGYPDPLWGPEGIDCLLLGQSVPCNLPAAHSTPAAWRRWCADAAVWVQRMPEQSSVLESLRQQPALAHRIAAMFSASGPAFAVPRRH